MLCQKKNEKRDDYARDGTMVVSFLGNGDMLMTFKVCELVCMYERKLIN